MYQFPIGVMPDSLKTDNQTAITKAAEIGAKGLQMYATTGKNVLCEKPISVSQKDAETMQAAAVKNNKLLMISFVRRYGNDCKILKDFIEKGFFKGEINHYVDCLINGTKCIAPAQDGIDIMQILDAVYESARTGHEVVL